MVADRPTVEAAGPGVLIVRCDWPHHLEPEMQGDLLERLRGTAPERGGLVYVLNDRICEIAPTVRGFWRRVMTDPAHPLAAMAIVTGSWAVEVEAQSLAVTSRMSGADLQVASFNDERDGVDWIGRVVACRAKRAAPA